MNNHHRNDAIRRVGTDYEAVYACDWQVASVPTVHTARDHMHQTPHGRTIRDATLTLPGAYIG